MFQEAVQHGRGLFRDLLRLRGIGPGTGLPRAQAFHAGTRIAEEVLRDDGIQGEGLMSRLSHSQLWQGTAEGTILTPQTWNSVDIG